MTNDTHERLFDVQYVYAEINQLTYSNVQDALYLYLYISNSGKSLLNTQNCRYSYYEKLTETKSWWRRILTCLRAIAMSLEYYSNIRTSSTRVLNIASPVFDTCNTHVVVVLGVLFSWFFYTEHVATSLMSRISFYFSHTWKYSGVLRSTALLPEKVCDIFLLNNWWKWQSWENEYDIRTRTGKGKVDRKIQWRFRV